VQGLTSGIGCLIVAIVLAAPAGAAVPTKRYYWPESRAEAFVVAKVKIPACNVYPDDNRCPGWQVSIAVISADCRGASELGTTFRYNRFTCKIILYNNDAEGAIAVYVVGPTTFHWKIL
jgi:hypothetical protein